MWDSGGRLTPVEEGRDLLLRPPGARAGVPLLVLQRDGRVGVGRRQVALLLNAAVHGFQALRTPPSGQSRARSRGYALVKTR